MLIIVDPLIFKERGRIVLHITLSLLLMLLSALFFKVVIRWEKLSITFCVILSFIQVHALLALQGPMLGVSQAYFIPQRGLDMYAAGRERGLPRADN